MRSKKLRGGGATKVLNREDSGNRHSGERETELGFDSGENTRGDKRAALK